MASFKQPPQDDDNKKRSIEQEDAQSVESFDKEMELFRQQMTPPGHFEDGFSWSALLGALFIGALMVPGAMYMTLLAGQGIGPAAQWVTLILFIEVARRANKTLGNAEIFTLFYLAGTVMITANMALGQFHGGLSALYFQFLAQSESFQAAGLSDQLPFWVVPSDPAVLEQRSLFMRAWLPCLGLIAFTMIIGRLDRMVLGYGLFRLTSDVERLPFPMAPIGAQGILALSEEQSEESWHESDKGRQRSWRWRVFSIGSVIGLVFGMIYLGLPTITGALLPEPITIIPIPFVDFTQQTGNYLPAAAVGLSFNLGDVLVGMILPFWAVTGTFIGLLVTLVANPTLYHFDILTSWTAGDNLQSTFFKCNLDFYFSFSIGVALAIAIAGAYAVTRRYRSHKKRKGLRGTEGYKDEFAIPAGRGDIKTRFIFVSYFITSSLYILVSMLLLHVTDGFIYWPVIGIMLFYAFVFTPIISYMSARLEGIAGQALTIPFVREATFILSGYHGVAIWFLPIPFHNYGQMTVFYRQAELTGTSFRSIWKAELLLVPIILIGGIGFAHVIWQMGEIPGPRYPFAQEWWEVTAAQQAIVFSSTLGGFTQFEQALNISYIGWGLGLGVAGFSIMGGLGLPIFLMYGVIRGLNQTLPFMVIPQFLGALLGRFVFQRRYGAKRWRQIIPVLFAGFSCGMGLVGTLALGFVFLQNSVIDVPF